MQAFEDGVTPDEIFEYTKIDPWFIAQLAELHKVGGLLESGCVRVCVEGGLGTGLEGVEVGRAGYHRRVGAALQLEGLG